jgi:hypothetical protein
MAHGSPSRAAFQSNSAHSSGEPWFTIASTSACSNCTRDRGLPLGFPLTPGGRRFGLPGLNCVSGFPDSPGKNFGMSYFASGAACSNSN